MQLEREERKKEREEGGTDWQLSTNAGNESKPQKLMGPSSAPIRPHPIGHLQPVRRVTWCLGQTTAEAATQWTTALQSAVQQGPSSPSGSWSTAPVIRALAHQPIVGIIGARRRLFHTSHRAMALHDSTTCSQVYEYAYESIKSVLLYLEIFTKLRPAQTRSSGDPNFCWRCPQLVGSASAAKKMSISVCQRLPTSANPPCRRAAWI